MLLSSQLFCKVMYHKYSKHSGYVLANKMAHWRDPIHVQHCIVTRIVFRVLERFFILIFFVTQCHILNCYMNIVNQSLYMGCGHIKILNHGRIHGFFSFTFQVFWWAYILDRLENSRFKSRLLYFLKQMYLKKIRSYAMS